MIVEKAIAEIYVKWGAYLVDEYNKLAKADPEENDGSDLTTFIYDQLPSWARKGLKTDLDELYRKHHIANPNFNYVHEWIWTLVEEGDE